MYEEIKRRVSMEEVARRYGLDVKRGVCLCPFHHEKTPSLRLYKTSFYCFGCGAGGDVIAFVARWCGCSQRQAAAQINADFRLGIAVDGPPDYRAVRERERAQKERQKRDKAIRQVYQKLVEYRRVLWRARQGEPESPLWFLSLAELETVDHCLDEYEENPDEFYKNAERMVGVIGEKLHRIAG